MRALLAVLLLLAAPLAARADAGPAGRIYLGGASGRSGNSTGQGAVLGFESHTMRGTNASTGWGLEILGVKVGEKGMLPILGGNFGLRYVFLADAPVRPFVKANVGLNFLLIVPVPSASVSAGVGVPLGQVHLDLTLSARQYVNIFSTDSGVTVGAFELGVGF